MNLALVKRAMTVKGIAERYKLSHNYLMKVVPKLVELSYAKKHFYGNNAL